MADSRQTLARRACSSHGVFSREEALASGVDEQLLDLGVKQRRYEVVHEGVYVHAGAPRSLQMYQAAACRWAGSEAALSHRSALTEYGLGDVKAEEIEITTIGKRCQYAPVLLHRTTYLPRHHVRRRDGLSFTDVARTLFDAGSVVPLRTVCRATEEALYRRLTTKQELIGRLIEHGGRGRRGCGSLRRALHLIDPLVEKTDSSLEVLMLQRVWNGTLPRPVVQYPVKFNGRTLRLDFAYPNIKLGIEGDGFDKHGLRAGFEGDRARDADLMAGLGWMILRFTWRQVRDRPDWVTNRIHQAIELRTTLFFGEGDAR